MGGELKAKADLSQAEANLAYVNKLISDQQSIVDVRATELANAKTDWDEKEAAAVKAEADWASKEEATDKAKEDWDKKEAEAETSEDARKAADDAKAVYEELYDFYLQAVTARKGADHAKLNYEVTFPENLKAGQDDLEELKLRIPDAEEKVADAKKPVQQCLDALPLDKRST